MQHSNKKQIKSIHKRVQLKPYSAQICARDINTLACVRGKESVLEKERITKACLTTSLSHSLSRTLTDSLSLKRARNNYKWHAYQTGTDSPSLKRERNNYKWHAYQTGLERMKMMSVLQGEQERKRES